jgi:hypothetical protein
MVIHDFEGLKEYIERKYHISIEDQIKDRFRNDEYLIDTLIKQANLPI